MVLGVLRITLILHGNDSLKGKRQVLKAVKDRVRNRFNVSIAEAGHNDMLERADVAVAAIGSDKAYVNSVLDNVLNFIEGFAAADVAGHAIELLNL
ncbi:MAG: DUF503 domain-containing protein [Deltaproteobacteria bacterium]|nr:DUF503 domain-containing protein [Deltaproteobacteria bacterium]